MRGAIAWHDVECASYRADLPVWRTLAQESAGALLDLGAGSGRVALDLAGRGHRVTALDTDIELLSELSRRARDARLRVETAAGDARSFSLPQRFSLSIAPMQLMQLLGGRGGRRATLERVRAHLSPGGVFAVALADPFEAVPAEHALPPLPDVLERDGWILSSQPVAMRPEAGGVSIERLRQLVSPAGELSEELFTVCLELVRANDLEAEARELGYRPLPRQTVPETPDHVGSTVVVLEAP